MSRVKLILAFFFFCLTVTACQKQHRGLDGYELSKEPFNFPVGLAIPGDVRRTSEELGGEGVRFDTSLSPAELAEYYRREIAPTGLREDSTTVLTEHALAMVFRGWPGRRVLSVKASRLTSRSNVLVHLGHVEAP